MKNIPLMTEVHLPKPGFDINYHTPILMMGSCFTDNIGTLLINNKFDVLKNPFGVLYNPMSIAQLLSITMNNIELVTDDLVFHNGLWHSFLFHGSFSNTDPKLLLEKANIAIQNAHSYLKKTKFLIVSFGTSWVYTDKTNDKVVSNCHKIPEKAFNRYKLSVDTIFNEWTDLLNNINRFNPELRIIFTVSPIRHLKDGAHQNQLSKSTLLIAIDEIVSRSNPNRLSYFPAYEIVMDELRDYRFYAPDMIHLSEIAVEYLFNRFQSCFFNSETLNCINEIQKIVLAKEHRILTGNIPQIIKFGESQLSSISCLESKYPEIDFSEEKKYFAGLTKMKDGF